MRKKMNKHKEKAELAHLLQYERPDGRPEVYDVGPPQGEGYKCFVCTQRGFLTRFFKEGEIYMVSPLNTPGNASGGMICKEHLPDDAVIYDPRTDKCRDKSGENVWSESTSSQPSQGEINSSRH